MKIVVLLIVLSNLIFPQTDWKRWEKAESNYSIRENMTSVENNVQKKTSILSSLKNGYSFFISDLDGDNCPFYPTCSSFYVESVSETNIIKGTLMFADRFTRDSNLFKTHDHYPVHISGRLYDPIGNYLLADSTVVFYSRESDVK